MYLSDRELREAIKNNSLIVEPVGKIGPSSIDIHLDVVEEAQVWDMEKVLEHNQAHGYNERELRVSRIQYGTISEDYLKPPPHESETNDSDKVFRRDQEIVLRPLGFVLWQTKERIGTPLEDPKFICFIDGKSTRARTGLVVHLTAPTIHAGWNGHVTLEMANLGPFDIVLFQGDAVAQLTVARLTSCPELSQDDIGSVTLGQTHVTGRPTR